MLFSHTKQLSLYANIEKFMRQYYPFINVARFIAIFLVIVGHVTKNEFLFNAIFSFHMPLFFILSGLLFTPGVKLGTLAAKKFKSLIVPYFFFYLLTLAYFWAVEVHFRESHVASEWMRLLPLLLGNNYASGMSHNIVLWFLPTLFCIEIASNIIYNRLHSDWGRITIVLAIGAIGFALAKLEIWELPWGISQAMVMLPFYFVGIYGKGLLTALSQRKAPCIIVFILSAITFIYLTTIIGKNAVQPGLFPSIPLFVLSSLVGSLLAVSASILIGSRPWLEALGAGSVTLVVMALHEPLYRPLIIIAGKLAHTDARASVALTLGVAVVTFVLCYFASVLYNRYVASRLNSMIKKDKNR